MKGPAGSLTYLACVKVLPLRYLLSISNGHLRQALWPPALEL